MSARMTAAAGLSAALAARETSGEAHATLFRHGSLVAAFVVPGEPLAPHPRDAVYVVAAGSGTFATGDTRQPVGPGEALFAAAGVPHHFEDVTDDFGTWVFFYGPVGGEGDATHIPTHA